MSVSPTPALPKFVRVTGIRNQRFVEFDFAVGEPELFVELILPLDHFAAFCADNQVVQLDEAAAARIEGADQACWTIWLSPIRHCCLSASIRATPTTTTRRHPHATRFTHREHPA